jgi:hypothetical protein
MGGAPAGTDESVNRARCHSACRARTQSSPENPAALEGHVVGANLTYPLRTPRRQHQSPPSPQPQTQGAASAGQGQGRKRSRRQRWAELCAAAATGPFRGPGAGDSRVPPSSLRTLAARAHEFEHQLERPVVVEARQEGLGGKGGGQSAVKQRSEPGSVGSELMRAGLDAEITAWEIGGGGGSGSVENASKAAAADDEGQEAQHFWDSLQSMHLAGKACTEETEICRRHRRATGRCAAL